MSRRKIKLLAIALPAVLLGLAIPACRDGIGGLDPESTLYWSLGTAGPKTIDPALNGATDGGDILSNLYEGLTREQAGVVKPGIAESWEFTDNDTTITFKLRDSKWSDGSKLTAHDFVYSWKRGMDPATASEYAWIWEYTNVVGAQRAAEGEGSLDEVGIEALDDNTLQVKVTRPTDYLVSLLSFYHFMPVKQSSVEAGPEGSWAIDPELAISNGPFKLTSYTVGEGLTMRKNRNYWKADEVGLSAIEVAFIDNDTTAYTAYQAGEFDFLSEVPTAEIPKLAAENPEFYIFPLLGTYYYNFNLDLDMWKDEKVRRALALAIDREKITEIQARGSVPASGFVPVGFVDHEGNDFAEVAAFLGTIPTDESGIEEAKRLLAEAGYPNGEGFPKFTIMYNTSETHKQVAEMVQEMWKTNLGIETDLENQEWAVFQDTRKMGDYELSRGGWLTDFMDPMGMLAIFMTENAYNDPNYYNSDFDALLSEANKTTGAAHFDALYLAEAILMEDLPIVPVYHYTEIYLSSPQVKNWTRSVLSALDFSNAYLER